MKISKVSRKKCLLQARIPTTVGYEKVVHELPQVVGSVSWYQESEVDAPGKSRESQILPSVREPTSGERETSLITAGFGIEFHPPPPVTILEPLSGVFTLPALVALVARYEKLVPRFLDAFHRRPDRPAGGV